MPGSSAATSPWSCRAGPRTRARVRRLPAACATGWLPDEPGHRSRRSGHDERRDTARCRRAHPSPHPRQSAAGHPCQGRFREGFLHCRRGGMWHGLKRNQGQVFQLQALRRIRQSAQPDADDREALHHADLDRVVDEDRPNRQPAPGSGAERTTPTASTNHEPSSRPLRIPGAQPPRKPKTAVRTRGAVLAATT